MSGAVLDKPAAASPARRRLRLGAQEHFEVTQFLEDEAFALDEKDFEGWFDMLHEDLVYQMPVRVSRPTEDGEEFARGMFHFDEDKSTILLKARRLMSKWAWSENPASRTRRLVTNVRVHEGDAPGEYEVASSLVMLRYRRDMDVISAKRVDVVATTPEGLKLKRRTIFGDQTTLLTQNLTVFL